VLLLRSVFFTILLPGTVAGLIPYNIVSRRAGEPVAHWGPAQYAALVPIAVGAAILLRCIWEFARQGRGTLAPVDPPRHLVVTGLYRHVRNPMYLGVLLVLLGESTLFSSLTLLKYAAGFALIAHLFVLLYEEPALRARFGDSYERYRQSVRRWIPGRPYSGS